MKTCCLIFLCFISYNVYCQQIPAYDINRVRITQPDKTIVAEIEPGFTVMSAKPLLNYYWYSANDIHCTQGGYSGKLLNGTYIEYYPDKNLKEQGSFKKGLKSGVWKKWNNDGTLASVTTWKRGLQRDDHRIPIWKRIHLFKKKRNRADTSTPSKK
ncbi:MAG TPA: hypothetical protein VIM89_05020 [Mucilaginibacter sp.]